MKKLLLVILTLTAQITFGQEDPAVKEIVLGFFKGLNTKDTGLLKTYLSADMVLHSISEMKAVPEFTTEAAADFIKGIEGIPADVQIEERILSWKISVDRSMAHVWTPYEFYVNGKLSHKGTNSIQLYNDGKGWKVIYIVDTRRK